VSYRTITRDAEEYAIAEFNQIENAKLIWLMWSAIQTIKNTGVDIGPEATTIVDMKEVIENRYGI